MIMETEDSRKYALLLEGDTKAFEWFFKKYQPRMFAFCYDYFHDEMLAKDLVQESFAAFWESHRDVRNPDNVGGYLFGIMRNLCLREVRLRAIRGRLENRSLMEIQEMELSAWNGRDRILDEIYSKELQEKYSKSLDTLSEQCRKIFSLSRDSSMKYSEIASRLGISQRTVENEVYRSLKVLKKSLKEYIPAVAAFIITNIFVQ